MYKINRENRKDGGIKISRAYVENSKVLYALVTISLIILISTETAIAQDYNYPSEQYYSGNTDSAPPENSRVVSGLGTPKDPKKIVLIEDGVKVETTSFSWDSSTSNNAPLESFKYFHMESSGSESSERIYKWQNDGLLGPGWTLNFEESREHKYEVVRQKTKNPDAPNTYIPGSLAYINDVFKTLMVDKSNPEQTTEVLYVRDYSEFFDLSQKDNSILVKKRSLTGVKNIEPAKDRKIKYTGFEEHYDYNKKEVRREIYEHSSRPVRTERRDLNRAPIYLD